MSTLVTPVSRTAGVVLAGALVALGIAACSGTTTQQGGLELLLATNLSMPGELDGLSLEIDQQQSDTADGGSFVLRKEPTWALPSGLQLPTSYAILAGLSPEQVVLIRLTGFKNNVPVVLRRVEVEVPTDRVLELPLVLAADCYGQVQMESGEAQPICQAGYSCQPSTGVCGPDLVDPSTLGPYHPGDEADAGGDATIPPQPSEDGGTTDATDAPPCRSECTVGATRCTSLGASSGQQTCATSTGGCAAWGAPAACAADSTCAVTADAGACTCNTGYAAVPGGCSIAAPRPIYPLSTSTVTMSAPTFTWALADGTTTGAQIEICASDDRICASPLQTVPATGETITAGGLQAGLYYWRAKGMIGSAVGTQTSPTWELAVGPRSATTKSTSWGTFLDVNGDGFADVAIGAPQASGGSGSVMVFRGGAGGLSVGSPSVATLGNAGQVESGFGGSVASAGDVNGDGYSDLIVGASNDDADDGAAYVYVGGPTGVSPSPAKIPAPTGAGSFGLSVRSVGDVNADGYADVAISAYATGTQLTQVYLYLGGSTGLSSSPALVLVSPDSAGDDAGESLNYFGENVASSCDVNGDGQGDVITSDPRWNVYTGRVYVYLTLASDLTSDAGAILPADNTLTGPGGSTGQPAFGNSLACAGDVNGDGYADVIVSAPGGSTPKAYVYLGGAGGLSATPWVSFNLPNTGATSVAGEDLDGDGYADLLLGLPGSGSATGAVTIYQGGTSPPTSSIFTLNGPASTGSEYSPLFGTPLGTVGDINGDAHGDLVVGAWQTDHGPNGFDGAAYCYVSTTPFVWPASASQIIAGPVDAGGDFGQSIAAQRGAPRAR